MQSNPLKVDFSAKQLEFAAYIRDPEHHPVPLGIKKKRMQMYRQLFFNNIESFLSGNFPVLRQLMNDAQWLALVQDFFAQHPCTTPYFVNIPEEFLVYLEQERQNSDDFPFLLELAHYEWVEMALSIAKETPPENQDHSDNILDKSLCLSSVAWPLAYAFPVHKICPDYIPLIAPAQPTFFVVYRDKNDDVHFVETTAVTYRLLEMIQQNENITAKQCLQQLAQETQSAHPDHIIAAGVQTIKELAEKNIIAIV